MGGWGGGTGINDSTNGCSVETVDPDGTASLSSVFITLQGEREGAVSIVHSSNLGLQHLQAAPPQLSADRPVSPARRGPVHLLHAQLVVRLYPGHTDSIPTDGDKYST